MSGQLRIYCLCLLPLLFACADPASQTPHRLPPKPRASRSFSDITVSSGVGAFLHSDGSSGRRYFPEQVAGGCVIFDYDNDGWPDIFFSNAAPLPGYKGAPPRCALYHNNHNGTFTDVTRAAGAACAGHYGIGAVAGDFDNDG